MRTQRLWAGLALCWALGGLSSSAAGEPWTWLAGQHVVWSSPSTNVWGTMPLGNGDLALNAWVEPDGDLCWYLSKSDAWDAHARLLKLGLVRVQLSPNPFAAGQPFRQELNLGQGAIEIVAGAAPRVVRLRLWVDAARPVVHLEGESGMPISVRCRTEPWRTARRVLTGEEASGSDSTAADAPVVVDPDVVLSGRPGVVAWYHRNERSIWESTLRHQGMSAWIPEGQDPLLHRTFGAWMKGSGLRSADAQTLVTEDPRTRFQVSVQAWTARTDTPEAWVAGMEARAAEASAVPIESAWEAHRAWWRQFWERSWIRVSTRDPARQEEVAAVQRGYVLQRFLQACAGRGAYPIKFNGSLFTVPPPGSGFDADYRRWGGCYWFQNTRLAYWPMLASGDFDLLEPLFRMYRDALPLARARTRLHFGHDGAYFSETGHFWGAWHNGDLGWGWDRKLEPPNRSLNQYIRYHWSGGLELLALMLERQSYAPEAGFLRDSILPIADALLEFYSAHYPRQPDGRILFVPAQALETWWETENPTPEVAGLRSVIPDLLRLPREVLGETRVGKWRALLDILPPVPRRTDQGRTFVLPAEAFRTQRNMENPELYAVFPFRVFGVGRPELEVGVETYRRRQYKGNVGWQQDDTQAACLGLTEEARAGLVRRLTQKHPESRFPAFWGPNFDWIPDQDHGANALMTLQTMLLQHEGRRLLLLPAWPKDWDVDFRLHGPDRTLVEGELAGGHLLRFTTTPAARQTDAEGLEAWK